MAREQLDVTVVVFANRTYAILQVEFMRVGAHDPGAEGAGHARSVTTRSRVGRPATSMGVPAVQATDAESFNAELERGFSTHGPYLIEALI